MSADGSDVVSRKRASKPSDDIGKLRSARLSAVQALNRAAREERGAQLSETDMTIPRGHNQRMSSKPVVLFAGARWPAGSLGGLAVLASEGVRDRGQRAGVDPRPAPPRTE